jgi:hypothetical protein
VTLRTMVEASLNDGPWTNGVHVQIHIWAFYCIS